MCVVQIYVFVQIYELTILPYSWFACLFLFYIYIYIYVCSVTLALR